MGRRFLPVALALAAWVADRHGADGIALDILLAAVPCAAAAGLAAFGDALDGVELARIQAALWGLVLGLLVLSCLARNVHRASGGSGVPALGASTLAAVFALLVLKACISAALALRRLEPRPAKP